MKLEIQNLHVSVVSKNESKPILHGVNVSVERGETHVIMGPNGSGKSTLAYAIAGHPNYEITSGTVTLDGEDILAMTVDERARKGLFLGMQHPVEIPGVSVSNFLRVAKTAKGGRFNIRDHIKEMKQSMRDLNMQDSFANRFLNEGFSGGEKKRNEILQLKVLKPNFAILDEIDSGLDVDALKLVSQGINDAKASNNMGVLMITHYNRILQYVSPDFVHVLVNGKIVETGKADFAAQLEVEGYDKYL
jgi:Fe-S cluster assembly ATP-binding protein